MQGATSGTEESAWAASFDPATRPSQTPKLRNLLRSLATSQVKPPIPEADLKLLLQTVKDGRKLPYDAKLSDPFYDALEDMLHDLRTVTMDNHDADAFIKPVSRADVPDYYDVISTPMDLQTMLKKVKQKQYKSKKEFKDDLDLIWSNCFTYNATENHPLRMCATRLKAKAERLLKPITDRKERADPPIPVDLSLPRRAPKPNGINGHTRTHSGSPFVPPSLPYRPPCSASSPYGKRLTPAMTPPRRDLPFAESIAIARTPEGMAAFLELDRAVDAAVAGPSTLAGEVFPAEDRLRELAGLADLNAEVDGEDVVMVDADLGDKRKINGVSDGRPRKRIRLTPHPPTEPIELWWSAQKSDTLLANSLPPLPSMPSSSGFAPPPSSQTQPTHTRRASTRKKKRPKATPRPNSLLALMNANITTLRRVRKTHTKFALLGLAGSGGGDDEGGLDVDEAARAGEAVDVAVDERAWTADAAEPDLGDRASEDCMHWVNRKVLEHVGFQGTSKMALDVLSSITSEYLLNVGRTLRFYMDKYSNAMTPEEIILHTLFESGTTRIQALERYVKDDVLRHGNRLNDLEKKILNVYQEVTTTEAIDDDALFGNEDEEEESAFVMGQFTEDIGEDFLGLRELGIAQELGMSSLSIPKKLLKGKKNAVNPLAPAKTAEPPLPYPLPPPFIPIDSHSIDNQIGLLKPFYQHRLSSLATLHPAPPPPYPGAPPPLSSPPLVLPDDPPNPAQAKLGPLGQVLRPSAAASSKKKASAAKAKAADVAAAATPSASVFSPGPGESEPPSSPKKKKVATTPVGPSSGPGTGTGKKRGRPPGSATEGLPPVVAASA
ncbi:hypothetical protein FA95DRAFT_1635331 [Auriscalpium vulgare]|uniref:Uncharacterized protein n=1 Tax=Auriscalpium vulgare TaxID=40419 RepID=A0ACB8S4V8_9AGAM|nr:hypothetical protein FA95DRAFT_1635331 [Auriscalpium vulgare]